MTVRNVATVLGVDEKTVCRLVKKQAARLLGRRYLAISDAGYPGMD
jgi:hypothetical protein